MSDQVTRAKEAGAVRLKAMMSAVALTFMLVWGGTGPVWALGDEIFPGQNMRLPDNSLVEAARTGNIAGIRNALMRGIPVDDGGVEYVPAIIVAAANNQADAVRFLLEQGANPNRKARDGRTALSAAAQSGNAMITAILLDAKANPDLIADNGDSPLFIAVRGRRAAIVQQLLAHNVDLTDTDITGRTALDEAEERNFDEIAQMLRDAGA
ncbi:MAG: ankyrin repeat domain-containing protein [Parvibaculum sp.]|nr:ankyrin repeat domain-containing protein [Parvibaculum sp.]